MSRTATTKFTVEIPTELHKKLKMLSAYHDMSMKDILVNVLEEGVETYQDCPYSHEPNEETKKAIEDSKKKRGSITAMTVKELFKKLAE